MARLGMGGLNGEDLGRGRADYRSSWGGFCAVAIFIIKHSKVAHGLF